MSVTGPSRKRQVALIHRPGQPPENVELFTEDQFIVEGWDDITADLTAGKPGATSPTWASYRDGIYAWSFGAASDDEIFITFHIKHDYADGTKVYPHFHFSPPGGSTATGVVRIGFEYTVQKGHQQGAFPATTTVYVDHSIDSADPYGHRIAEVSDAQAFSAFEADSLILMRVFRNGSHANDTFGDPIFGLTADIHFQTDRQSTPNKSPPFTAR